ncbi:MAG: glycosyltransferase family 2 protein [Nitrosomonadales bacterium]|nr:glycosyltransferase family 2 protein [Nitrosomonadales bacterium]
MPTISISIVSHLQGRLLNALLLDLDKFSRSYPLEILLTLNLPETLPFSPDDFSCPVNVYTNPAPLGFAANHNRAFARSSGGFFCVMNPDIRIEADPFRALLDCLSDAAIGVAAPLVLGEDGAMEDSARHFPTPLKILCKAFGGCKGSDYSIADQVILPDWVGGMFMLFRREVYEQLGGFDQRYFLYYEDVDLCARLRLLGYEVALCPAAQVVHHAHRSSHRNLKYLRLHLASMLRFFMSRPFLKICWQKWLRPA